MRRKNKYNFLLKSLPFAIVFAAAFTWLMASMDAYEWFYRHSRQYEAYDYDDVVLCLFFFLTIGMSWLSFLLGKKALSETANNCEAAYLYSRVAPSGSGSLQEIRSRRFGSRRSPLLLVISILVMIGAVEMLDMVLLQFLPPLPDYLVVLIDPAFLMLMMSPTLYFFFFRPLLRQILIREQAEASLKQLTLQLEKRVEQRTAQLQTELEERKRTETALVENHQRIRFLSAQLALVEERERHRIATELHDNIGHTLAMANNRLGILKASLPTEQGEKALEDIKELISEAIGYSRSLSSKLSSAFMDYLSFVSAVDWLAEDILESNGVAFGLKVTGSPDMPAGDTRIIIVKAIREILVNVVKHAQAKSVEISIRTEGDDIAVEIRDDGIGFDTDAVLPASLSDRQRLGIFTIRERMAYLKGRFLITSEPGRGTSVTLSVPFKNEQGEKTS
ncbi:MAG: histidine kinase [Syntrophales bacterium]|nr:histidine kinase [Syntrophales bacterium]